MGLGFLYPLVWLGALAVGIPIWLHLRRRMDRNAVRFSALRFLDDEPVAQRSPLRLRDILLFALRALAVLLLVAAFAWPYYRTGALKESRVYILDNTLSHQADDGFESARDRLVKDLARSGADAQSAVIELTGRSRVVSGFGDTVRAAAEKVKALGPSFQRGSYAAALRQADTVLANAMGPKTGIHIYSDNQENQWSEILKAPPFLEDVEIVLSESAKATAPNLAVARPQLQRGFVGSKTVVDFAVELFHQGAAQSATWTLRANGRDILRRQVDLSAQPKTMMLTAQWEADPLVAIGGEVIVEGEPDALAADNRVFFSLPPVEEGTVRLLAGSPFLRAALSPEVMRGFWATRFLEADQVAGELQRQERADVLCVESQYFWSADIRNLVLQYLDNGHGVLLIVNYASPLVRSFLDQLGFELRGESAADAQASTFRYVFTDHPVFRPFRSPDFGNLTEIKVRKHYRLAAPHALPLIFSQSGDVLFFETPNRNGRLFVCAFGFDRKDTSWPLHPTFVPFLDLCLRNARKGKDLPTTFEPGERFVRDLPPEPRVERFVLSEGDREILRGSAKNGRVEFAMPDVPGLYTLTYRVDDGGGTAGAKSTVQTLLSVNPSPLESDLTYLQETDTVQAKLVLPSSEDKASERTGAARELARAQILQQRTWWTLVLGGLVLLLIESIWLVLRRGR